MSNDRLERTTEVASRPDGGLEEAESLLDILGFMRDGVRYAFYRRDPATPGAWEPTPEYERAKRDGLFPD